MRIRNMVGAALMAAVFAAGCGDDGSTSASSDGGSSGGGAVSAATWCVDGEKLGESFDTLDLDPSMASADLKKTFSEMSASLKTLADKAPSEIKADVKVFADAIGTFNSALAKYNYDFAKIATDPKAIETLSVMDDPKIEEATARVQAWVEKNCPNAGK